MKRSESPDLVRALREIEQEARETRRKFQRGEVANGRTAIRRIEERAGDALARVKEASR